MITKFFKNNFYTLYEFKKYLNLNKKKKEIIFYAEKESDYDFFRDIIEDLTINKNLAVTYITSDSNDLILKKKTKNLFKFYLGNTYIRTIFFSTLNTKILVMTLPDLGNYEIKRSKYSVHYIYVPHTLLSTHMIFRDGAFDNFDTFFCPGRNHSKEIREMEKIKKKKKKVLLNFGYPRLDKIIKTNNKRKKNIVLNKKKIKILLAPSWGKNGLFENGAEKIIKFLLEKEYIVTIRPHPETLKLNLDVINKLLLSFKNYNNFLYKPNISSLDDYFNNNILISDWSGAAFEFAFGTLKPVLFLDLPRKVNNKNYKKIKTKPMEIRMRNEIGYIVDPNNFSDLNKKIQSIVNTKNIWKKKLFQLRKETIFNLGSSGKVGSNYIYNLSKQN